MIDNSVPNVTDECPILNSHTHPCIDINEKKFMKTTIGVLSLLAVLVLVGTQVVKNLQQMTITAGGAGAVLTSNTSNTTQQQENRQELIEMVKHAINKAQLGVDTN